MSDKRIIEYETANALADDDYILLDSETGGTCKIKAKKLEPPLPNRITATYTQTITVKDSDSLDVLRQDLVVKAYYDGGVVETVTNYTLSGTLEVGTSTITASYKGKSDSFDVTVESSIVYLYNWDFTQSLTDSVQGVVATLGNNATFTQGVGVSITHYDDYLQLITTNNLYWIGKTLEIDIASQDKQFTDRGGVFNTNYNNLSNFGYNFAQGGWCMQRGSSSYGTIITASTDANVFSGKTLKCVIDSPTSVKVYSDNDLVYDGEWLNASTTHHSNLSISNQSKGFYNMTITGVRIYETPQGGN